MFQSKEWGEQEEARSWEDKVGVRSISDQGQGLRKENKIKDNAKMTALVTGFKILFYVLLKKSWSYSMEPLIAMTWNNRGVYWWLASFMR